MLMWSHTRWVDVLQQDGDEVELIGVIRDGEQVGCWLLVVVTSAFN